MSIHGISMLILPGLQGDTEERELDFVALRDLAHLHLDTYERWAAAPFPQPADVQLREAILAVFRSWNSEKARTYRELHSLSHAMGTAVTVQRMIFGNAGGMSGAGVGFTRNPSNGDPAPWVDFLFNAQGEDVVSGRRSAQGHDELTAVAPKVWAELVEATKRLERHFGDMQDFEFTVQDGQLYLLQTRTGKRTLQAAARIALDLLDEGVIDLTTACERTQGLDARTLAIRVVAASNGNALVPIASAATAASGVVCGEIALDAARVRERKAAGCPVILVRRDAETRDISALDQADGLLTQRGARTSHAAVVARQLGKVCLVGCDALSIHEADARITIGDLTMREGDTLTLDGNEGHVYAGTTEIREQIPTDLVARLEDLHPQDDPGLRTEMDAQTGAPLRAMYSRPRPARRAGRPDDLPTARELSLKLRAMRRPAISTLADYARDPAGATANACALRHDAAMRLMAVAVQAASAIQTMARETDCNAGTSATKDRRSLATAYMPSGNTMLQSVVV